ncbi:MAG: helix-turn-helix transcriptional regulator [Myxococcales bacterium]|nr:helix-turn-helix transcriptional regulator [Myxococcales bacterium]
MQGRFKPRGSAWIAFALVGLGAAPGVAAPLRVEQVPQPLAPWVGWALRGHEARMCPARQGVTGESAWVCRWPSRLVLVLDDHEGAFEQEWRMWREDFVPLPGDAKRWPEDVHVDDAAAALVLAAAGQPAPRVELPAGLTDREGEVLGLVARGLTSKEIAASLGITTRTVKHHIEHIYEKTGVSTRAAAALFAALAFLAVLIVQAVAGPVKDIEPNAAGVHPHPLVSAAAMKSAAAGLAVIPIVMLIAASAVKGQVLGTAIIAGVFAGLASRLVSPHVQPILIYPATVLGGLVAFLLGSMMLSAPFESAAALKRLPALVRPLPVDYLAGSLIGVSVGLSWATSFLHHEEPDNKARTQPHVNAA